MILLLLWHDDSILGPSLLIYTITEHNTRAEAASMHFQTLIPEVTLQSQKRNAKLKVNSTEW